MNVARTVATVLIVTVATAPAALRAQLPGRNIELSGTVGAVGGVVPVSIDGVSHAGVYGGIRMDGGIQGERLEIGLGARVWELVPTRTYGGHGVAAFVSGEWRLDSRQQNALRATVGAGFDDIDPGHGPYRENTGTSGLEFSLGFGREVIVPSGARAVLSADIVVPTTNSNVNGRRLPALELGFGYRLRQYHAIR